MSRSGPRRSRGVFITLEGPEGSGKSSQARRLVRTLRRAGLSVTALADPGSTALGRLLRQALLHTSVGLSPVAEALLFIGARVQLVEERVRPALERGHLVVCDRFHDSTVSYQGFGGGVDVPWLDRVGRRAIHGVMPELTVLLDVPTAQGFARLHRWLDRMERKQWAFHRRVRAGFLRLATREPRRFRVVDASGTEEAVGRQIEHLVFQHLSRRDQIQPYRR